MIFECGLTIKIAAQPTIIEDKNIVGPNLRMMMVIGGWKMI